MSELANNRRHLVSRAIQLAKGEVRKLRTSHLARNTAWMMVGQVSSYGAQAAYFIVLSRLLGVTEFGILAGAMALVSIFMPYGSMGSGIVFMRHVSIDRNKCRLYMGYIFLSSLTTSGFLILGIWILAPHVLDPKAATIVWMAAIAGCFSSPLTVSISQIFQTYEMPKTMTAFNIISNTMRFLTALAFAIFSHRIDARQWAMADMYISLLVAGVAVTVVIQRFGIPCFSIRLLPKRIFEGFGYAISLSASSIYNGFDKTLLSHYSMNFANGIYSLAYRITNFATMPSYAIEMAAVPRLFQKANGRMSDFRAYGNSLMQRSVFSGVIVSLVLFVAAPIIPHVVGSGFSSSVLALRWLCVLPLFRSIHEIAGSMLTASGHQRYRVAAQFLVAGGALVADLWLIPTYGWHGAAWASLFADALLAGLCYALLHIALNHKALRDSEVAS